MKLSFITIVIAFLIGALSSWYVTDLIWEQRKAEYIAEKYKQLSDLKQKQYIETVRLQDNLRDVQNDSAKELSELQEKYDRLLKSINGRTDIVSDVTFSRMQQHGARSSDSVSAITKATTDSKPKSKSRSFGQSCNNSQARELLKIAKECDEIAIKYNSLLDFYNSIYK